MHVQLCCRLRLCCTQRSKVKGSWGAHEKGNTWKERALVIRRTHDSWSSGRSRRGRGTGELGNLKLLVYFW